MTDGAMRGIGVVELGSGVAAPFSGKLFADYGADVVKIESPDAGDVTRQWGRFPGDKLLTVHIAQRLTYRKLTGLTRGLLINFTVDRRVDWIKRVSL